MIKNVTPYLLTANEILHIMQKGGPKKPSEYAVIIGLVASKVVEACVEHGEDRQTAVDALCKSVRELSEE